jgi:hypothetical protein
VVPGWSCRPPRRRVRAAAPGGAWLPERPENQLRLLRWVLDAREDRNREVADKLAALGTGVTYDEGPGAGGGVVGVRTSPRRL